jgi:hypothetical protein
MVVVMVLMLVDVRWMDGNRTRIECSNAEQGWR